MEVEKEEDQEGGIRSNSRFRYKTPCTHTCTRACIHTHSLAASIAGSQYTHAYRHMHAYPHTYRHACLHGVVAVVAYMHITISTMDECS